MVSFDFCLSHYGLHACMLRSIRVVWGHLWLHIECLLPWLRTLHRLMTSWAHRLELACFPASPTCSSIVTSLSDIVGAAQICLHLLAKLILIVIRRIWRPTKFRRLKLIGVYRAILAWMTLPRKGLLCTHEVVLHGTLSTTTVIGIFTLANG